MQLEKRRRTNPEVQEAVRKTSTINAAAARLGISREVLSRRLHGAALGEWWAALKAARKRARKAERNRRSWNRRRDRELLQWARAGGNVDRLGTRLRARLERARRGIPAP